MSTHTPTPWFNTRNSLGETDMHAHISSTPDEAGDIATCWLYDAKANAAFIVKASNYFDDLVACVRASLNMVDGDGNPPDWDFLRRTLKSAEAKDA